MTFVAFGTFDGMTFIDKMNIIIEKFTDKNLYTRLLEIWESSVSATHHFLTQDDYEFYKSRIISLYLPRLEVYYFFNKKNEILGFIGIFGEKLEMLFVDALSRGKGIGTHLLDYAINQLDIKKVDVNEQNLQAVNFYKKHGFTVVNRSEKDSEGKPYPILHMILE